MEEGTFMLAIHTLVPLPDATLLSSVQGAGPAWGEEEGLRNRSLPP